MARSDNSSKGCKHYGSHNGPNFKKNYRVPRVRMNRHKAATAIASGREPEARTRNDRHSALWDRY
jgi:hypothetical protein